MLLVGLRGEADLPDERAAESPRAVKSTAQSEFGHRVPPSQQVLAVSNLICLTCPQRELLREEPVTGLLAILRCAMMTGGAVSPASWK
jgi:hypothetical protein